MHALFEYYGNCCNGKRRSKTVDVEELRTNLLNDSDHKCKLLFNKDIDQLVAPKVTESDHSDEYDSTPNNTLSPPIKNRTMASSVTSMDLRADSSYSSPRRVSRILQVAIASCIIWYLCLDIYDYYTEVRVYQLRFIPLLFVFIGLAWDLQHSYGRHMIFFHSLWYTIGYLLMEDLLSSWAALTLDLITHASDWFHDWGGTIGHVMARMIAFLGYSASFQIIKRIARKFAIHSKQPDNSRMRHSTVQWDNFNSFDLQFIFMIYSDYFLFQFVTQNDFDWSFVGTLMLKMIWNTIKYHPELRRTSRLFVDNPLQFWFSYIYGILISWIVSFCQCSVYIADYFQPLGDSDDNWLFGSRERTIGNLGMALAMISIVFCCDMTVYMLSYDAQRENMSMWMKGMDASTTRDSQNSKHAAQTSVEMSTSTNSFGDRGRVGNESNDESTIDGVTSTALERGNTGLGEFIPFHRWYYTFIACFVAIKLPQIVLE